MRRVTYVLLLLSLWTRLGLSDNADKIEPNWENLRVVKIVQPFFFDTANTTNFVDMNEKEKLATIASLKKAVGSKSKLFFYDIEETGEFTAVGVSGGISSQLSACALTQAEIERSAGENSLVLQAGLQSARAFG